ncbi:hypothetical protein PYL83_11810 [Moraxella lacunata]|uniref:Uncharacterized protein n=1 Tax=Moraxella lacunata TaxID=477 RepID=A0A1B8Q2D6_MORLA|nr:hypothetical protein [Moraxella lacunata]MDH9219913.1 hypothetical protein [Moraxella lacunata]OBX61593.1 hypothetical protein A9Z63_07870 [Moraxella lacunata]OBX63029.1 hypothetical protein A9309_06495 [Moraxella lacunata]
MRKNRIRLFFILLPIPIILSIKPITNVVQGAKHIPITLPDGLSYNVNNKKVARVYVRDNHGRAYSAKCGEFVGTENALCSDKKNFGYDFTGYGVSIVSFTDRKNNNINDVIILRGKFVNQTTQEIIYVSTPKSDIDGVQSYFEKTGYAKWFLILIIVIIYIELIFGKNKEQAK